MPFTSMPPSRIRLLYVRSSGGSCDAQHPLGLLLDYHACNMFCSWTSPATHSGIDCAVECPFAHVFSQMFHRRTPLDATHERHALYIRDAKIKREVQIPSQLACPSKDSETLEHFSEGMTHPGSHWLEELGRHVHAAGL
jgi:hypothetical protein